MGIKITTKVNKLPQVAKTLEALSGKSVKVGALHGEHAWIAGIHEYGCRIKVTPKMRAYLHSQGLHLNPNTTEIVIPERSFIRTGHDENADRIIQQTERMIGLVIGGQKSVEDIYNIYGEQMATAIKKYARDLRTPENHPYTIEHKGSSNPLVDTGGMIESITWEVEG